MPFTFKLSRRLALSKLAAFCFVTAAVAVACNLERRTGLNPVHPLDHIDVVPSTLTLRTGQTADLAAVGISVVGDTNTLPLLWQITGGGLTDTFTLDRVHFGRYKAPRSVGNYMVIVSAAAGTPSDTAFVTVANVAVDTVIVAPSAATLFAGAQTQLGATPFDSLRNLLTGRVITWASNNPTIATVNGSGIVSGVGAGSATVTATVDTKSGSAAISVTLVPVAAVSVSPTTANLSVGATAQLTATPRDGSGNPLGGRPVTWTSDAPSVAVVNSSGLVTGLSAGSATISATSEGMSGSAAISVTVAPVASVTITPPGATVVVSGGVQLLATPSDSAGSPLTGRVVTWSSNAPAIASVSATGFVTGNAAGSATITATSEGKSGTAVITVTLVPVATVSVTPPSAGISVGGSVPLTATPRDGAGTPLTGRVVSWTSSGPAIATVIGSGVVTGASAGSVTITATSEGKSGSAAITVTPVPVASVTVSPASANVWVGGTLQLTATPKDGSGSPLTGRVVTWSSSAPTVASVNSNGLASGVAPGSATITATSEGKSGSSVLTVVLVPVASVTVTPAPASMLVGGTLQLTAAPKDSIGNPLAGRVVTWLSSDTTKAKVNGSGLVNGIAAGSTTITATSETKTGSSAITVTVVPVASVLVAPATVTTHPLYRVQLTATPKDSVGSPLTGRVVTWASNNTAAATVNGSGLVSGMAPGSATVTATSEGKSATSVITVTLAPVATVTVTPSSPAILVASAVQLTATLKDSAANTLTGRVVAWSSNAPLTASVSGSGLVTGVVAGSATITATSESKSGPSSVTVTALPPPPPPPPPVALCTDNTAPGVPPPLRTFYVDAVSGNDANNGLSPATAWLTLAKANATAQAGDLFLLSGTFTNQLIHPTASGTPAAKIVYRAKPGATAVISGGMYQAIVWIDGPASHIVVDGLELTNEVTAISLRYGANNIWLRNLYIHDIGSVGLYLITATDNRLEDSRILRVGSEAANTGEGIFIQTGANRNHIVRNTISYAGHGAVWVSYQSAAEATSDDNVLESNDFSNPWASGIGMNGKSNRTVVQCNKIHDTANGTGVNYARAGVEIEGDGNIVRFNEIFRSGATGLTIQGRTGAGFVQNATNNWVYNNTFWENGQGSGGAESVQMFQSDGNVQNNVIENNIFWNDAGLLYGTRYAIAVDLYHATNPWPSGSANGNIVRNNIFPAGQSMLLIIRSLTPNETFTVAQAQAVFAGWAQSLQADPLFVNEAVGDVHLLAGSAAIDAGRIIAGIPYLGIAPDLGAYERQ